MYIFKTCAAICENFVREFTTDLLTFIHSNWNRTIKTPDFFNISSIFFQHFVKNFGVLAPTTRRARTPNNFWRSQKLVALWVFFTKNPEERKTAPSRVPRKTKKCSIATFDSGFRTPRSLREKPLFFFNLFPNIDIYCQAQSIYSFFSRFSSTWQITYTSSHCLFPFFSER